MKPIHTTGINESFSLLDGIAVLETYGKARCFQNIKQRFVYYDKILKLRGINNP